MRKDADGAVQLLNRWRGDTQLQYMYSDGSEEIEAALKRLEIQHDHSIPGDPRNNARAERSNRLVLEGGRALLQQAGLMVQFWPYAIRHFCVSHNALKWKGGGSAWKLRFGKEFLADMPLWPIGCLVDYIPSETNQKKRAKMDPNGIPGVFLDRRRDQEEHVCY